jgi:hypothetical protein
VVLGHLLSGPNHLEANELVTTLLEASYDVANKAPLDSVGLASKKRPLLVGSRSSINGEATAVSNGRRGESGLEGERG